MADKPMMTFQTTPEHKERVHKIAEARGLSDSALIKHGVNLSIGMDSFTVSVAEEVALSLSAPLAVVFETCFLRWAAERDAHRKIYGRQPTFGIEFAQDGGHFIKGQRLYQNLRANFEQNFGREKRERLEKKIAALEPSLSDADLSDERRETYRAMHSELTRELEVLTVIQTEIDPEEVEKHLTKQREYIDKFLERDSEE